MNVLANAISETVVGFDHPDTMGPVPNGAFIVSFTPTVHLRTESRDARQQGKTENRAYRLKIDLCLTAVPAFAEGRRDRIEPYLTNIAQAAFKGRTFRMMSAGVVLGTVYVLGRICGNVALRILVTGASDLPGDTYTRRWHQGSLLQMPGQYDDLLDAARRHS